MDPFRDKGELRLALDGVVAIEAGRARVVDEPRLRQAAERLAVSATFGSGQVRAAAGWVLRAAAADIGAWPASIHPLYMARAAGKWAGATVPAINARFGYQQLRALMRAALDLEVGPVVFELARSEMHYTRTRPAEYAASIFAAAIREGWRGPLFIQGDHFQVSAARFAVEPEAELSEIEALIDEAVAAGFYNIDIDSSTLVDLRKPTVDEQQRPNYEAAVRLAARVREAQPEGVVISLGGEIGEVGGKNSTVDELEAYALGFQRLAAERGFAPGLSKVSVQTGTSHGGVVMPDGSIASVSVDFEVLRELSEVARRRFGMAGAVQHGASTLPVELFDRFPQVGTAEIHLATGYQNLLLDSEAFPRALRDDIYAYLRREFGGSAMAGVSDAQFIYRERKRLIGPFKRRLWGLGPHVWDALRAELHDAFASHFSQLGVARTRGIVARFVPRVDVSLASEPPL